MISSLIPAWLPMFSVAVHFSAGWWYVFAFMFLFWTFLEVVATEGIPLLMEIIGEQCILMNVRSVLSRSSWIRVSFLAGCLLYIWKDAESVIAGNSQWKLEKSTWNEPFSVAMNNNIIWVSDFCRFLLRHGGTVCRWEEYVALKDRHKQRWDALPLDKPI